jgi:Protein of unknown function (DUF3631)
MADHCSPILEFGSKPFTPTPAEQFDGAAILDRILAFIRRFIDLTVEQARIVVVWIAHTHAIAAATTTPYLNVNSATKRSGKTRLLEVSELLVARPWLTGRVSAACLVRKVDQVRPTLLLDESDAAFNGEKEYAEALRGILNTGFYSGGVASCCVGSGAAITYKDFKTYCAKAIAGIGHLPDTVADRSIPIRLIRKKPGETVERFRRRHAKPEADEIKLQLAEWISSIIPRLHDAEPKLPDELSDRQQDGLEPLLAIADEAGCDWPEALRRAATEIFRSQAAEDQNVGVQLLADIKSIFDADGDKIASADLVAKLKEIETSPWADWAKGKGLSQNALARLLKPFGIRPQTIRLEDRTPKGYLREAFQDVFERYLSREAPRNDFPTATSPQPACLLIETNFSNRNTKADVADAKSCLFIPDLFDTDGVGQKGHAICFHFGPTHVREDLAVALRGSSRFSRQIQIPRRAIDFGSPQLQQKRPLQHKTVAMRGNAQAIEKAFQSIVGQKHSEVLSFFVGQVQQSLAHRCRQVRGGFLHAIDSR